MKNLVLFLFLVFLLNTMVACAPSKKEVVEGVQCTWTELGQHTYPDGLSRKSHISACSNGCVRYEWVNDRTIRDEVCE